MDRVDPKGAALDEQDHKAAGNGSGGSVPPADGDRHGGADALPWDAPEDAAPGNAQGGAGGDEGGGGGGMNGAGEDGPCSADEVLRPVESVADDPTGAVVRYLRRIASMCGCTWSATMRTVKLHDIDDDRYAAGDAVEDSSATRKRYPKAIATIHFNQDRSSKSWSIVPRPLSEGDERDFNPTDDEHADMLAALAKMALPNSGPVPLSNQPLRGERRLLRDGDLKGMPDRLIRLIGSAPEGRSVDLPERYDSKGMLAVKDTDVRQHSYYVLRNTKDEIVMVQHRVDLWDGSKRYEPWSWWGHEGGRDGKWHHCEPEGLLPIWGAEQLAADRLKVFLHEGAKSAHAVRDLLSNKDRADELGAHPWREDFKDGIHLGWIGWAPNPARTDWSVLMGQNVELIRIVADQDKDGLESVPNVSRRLRGKAVFSIIFPTWWPEHFDLAEPLPDELFRKADEGRRYIGPPLSSYMEPATWATEFLLTGKKGKPPAILTQAFRRQWTHAVDSEVFVNIIDPRIQLSEEGMAKKVARFSDADGGRVVKLMLAKGGVLQTGIIAHVPGLQLGQTYKASEAAALIGADLKALGDVEFVNCYRDSPYLVEARHRLAHREPAGDASRWDDFLNYLFPIQEEREAAERWCMTLIARPQTRMAWGVLAVSEEQGTGKTSLFTEILWPLAGLWNCYAPNEKELVSSSFNSAWAGKKRVLLVDEIYQGHNWSAYNGLKTLITSSSVEVNGKHDKQYSTASFVHLYACSNSLRALRVDNKDRRWGIFHATEVKRDLAYFQGLRRWLVAGGLDAIADRAVRWGLTEAEARRDSRALPEEEIEVYREHDRLRANGCRRFTYVLPGEEPPKTQTKKSIIHNTLPEAAQKAADLCEGFIKDHPAKAFAMSSRISRRLIAAGEAAGSAAAMKVEQIPPEEFAQAMGNAGMKAALTKDGRQMSVRIRRGGAQQAHHPFLSPAAVVRLERGELDGPIVDVHGGVTEAAVREQLRIWLEEGERALAEVWVTARQHARGEAPM